MLSAFKTYIKKEKLLSSKDKVLLTVSGGVDSIVMCELFKQADISFGIAHCNFRLRGKESEEDENFVEALAEKYGVSFHSIGFETGKFAKKNKLSIQAAARKLRYDWFEELRTHFDYNSIATAHHSDDSIETFFINLIRGTGISGLHGILPKQGKIIRPLLYAGKMEILAFAKKNKLKFREDSSNSSEKYLRNKIRLKLVPLLKEINPDISHTLLENMQRLALAENIYLKEIEKQKKKILKAQNGTLSLSIEKLKELDPIEAYLFEFLRPLGFNASTVKDIIYSFEGQSGKQFFSETHRLVKDRKELLLEPRIKNQEPRNREQEAAGRGEIQNSKFKIQKITKELRIEELELTLRSQSATRNFQPASSPNIAALDFDKLKFPLTIRKWQNGDTFQPLGMKGKKKLSDFFIDRKFSLTKKENTWLLISGDDIVWVIGERMDDRFKINSKTKKIYFVHVD